MIHIINRFRKDLDNLRGFPMYEGSHWRLMDLGVKAGFDTIEDDILRSIYVNDYTKIKIYVLNDLKRNII